MECADISAASSAREGVGLERPDSGGRSTVYGTRGVVACEHPRAALAGIRMLDAGGTAADACVAMAAAMAVLSPMMTGPGGDAFLLHCDAATGAVRGLEGAGAGRAAARASRRCARGARDDARARRGADHRPRARCGCGRTRRTSSGRLGLARRCSSRARAGRARLPGRSQVSRAHVAARRSRRCGATRPPRRRSCPAARAAPGELVRLPDLARTLGAIAEEGARAFYEGEIAERIVAAMRAAGGFLEPEDLAAHRSSWVEPLHADLPRPARSTSCRRPRTGSRRS